MENKNLINRRDFLKAAGATSAALAFAAGFGTAAANPVTAEARSYGASMTQLVRSKIMLNCNMKSVRMDKLIYVKGSTFKSAVDIIEGLSDEQFEVAANACTPYNSKTKPANKSALKAFAFDCNETQALAIDSVNKRIYVVKATDSDNLHGVNAIFSAPLSATAQGQFKLVVAFGDNWMGTGSPKGGTCWTGHANGCCCIPDGAGTRLYIPTSNSDDNSIRTIYIPNAAAVDAANYDPANFLNWGKLGSWKCKFTPRGITYDAASRKFIARNGRSYASGTAYCTCYIFSAPTNDLSALDVEVSNISQFRVELPDSIYIPKGVFSSSKETFNAGKATGRGKQDITYHAGYLYLPVSDQSDKRYKKSAGNYRTNRNVILRFKIGSVAAAIANGNTLYRANKSLVDASATLQLSKQGYEIEGIEFYGNTLYFNTNESSSSISTSDRVRALM